MNPNELGLVGGVSIEVVSQLSWGIQPLEVKLFKTNCECHPLGKTHIEFFF